MNPLLIASAVKAGAGTVGALGGIVARKLSAEGQAEDRQATADIDALKRNEFGPTRGQKEQMTQDAVQLARNQAQAQRAESARQSAARGFGTADLSGQKIAGDAEKTAGSTRAGVESMAAQSARQLKLDALGRVTKRAEQTQADVASVFKPIEEAAGEATGAIKAPSAKGSELDYLNKQKGK
jgi:hypothetical protein